MLEILRILWIAELKGGNSTDLVLDISGLQSSNCWRYLGCCAPWSPICYWKELLGFGNSWDLIVWIADLAHCGSAALQPAFRFKCPRFRCSLPPP